MVYIIANIGINHNGSIDDCKKLILIAKQSGAHFVKIQKRNPDICIPESQKNIMKSTQWGEMTYLEYKHKIEFNEDQIKELLKYSKEIGIIFFASVWDIDSLLLMRKYTAHVKIPSAMITDIELLKAARDNFKFVIISTGMSTESEIENAVLASEPDIILHTNSTYPCPVEDLNLRYIEHLQNKYGHYSYIGYSGHENILLPTYIAVGMNINIVERHITLDKTLWGSDQSCSLEPHELKELITNIKIIEKCIKYKPQNRILCESEFIKKNYYGNNI